MQITTNLEELFPTLKGLSHPDKLRVIQFLVNEFVKEEATLLEANVEYPIWSPFNSFEAANTLLEALKAESKNA